MNYILDTDTIIYFLKNRESIVKKFKQASDKQLHTTIINHTELLFGAFNSNKKQKNLNLIEPFLDNITVLPFCKDSSYIFAEHKAKLKRTGTIIADLDLMIASISLKNNMTLITNNIRHFKRISGLKLNNWLN